jgi:hypothetical protein
MTPLTLGDWAQVAACIYIVVGTLWIIGLMIERLLGLDD